MIEEHWVWEGNPVRSRWMLPSKINKKLPVTQSYGICFTPKGNVLVCLDGRAREGNEYGWALPGGTPEPGEIVEETLVREINEEVSVSLGAHKLIGYQEIWHKKTPHPKYGAKYYQARFVAIIKKLNRQKIDPCTKTMYRRKLIAPEAFTKTVHWGKVSDEIFRVAYAAFKQWKKKGHF
ncbi:NUDIX domain-containing protein [Candidatus Woesearchaeota archaeon]|nr:NUDIX domain-containing protein [Candidatus Woesearchaeota archaeon]